jgi:DNA-binding NarL/FixJ family response regulator
MGPSYKSAGRVLVIHHLELVAFGLASLFRESELFAGVAAATTIGEIFGSLEAGVDLIVLGAPCLKLIESASNEAFQRGTSVSSPKIVIISSNVDSKLLDEAKAQGIDAVIDAQQSAEAVMNTVISILDSELKPTGVHAFQHWKFERSTADFSSICRDDTDVLIIELIIQGHSNDEIAEKTFSALQTVRNRISRLLSASGAKNRTQLAMMFSRADDSRRDKTVF